MRHVHPVRLRNWLSLTGLTALLALGSVQAQGSVAAPVPAVQTVTPERTAAVCQLTRTFVDATVNGAPRGGTLLLTGVGETWISPDLLQGSERGYIAETVSCPDGTFVRLNPLLDVIFDPAELTLEVRTRLDLLPGNTLDLSLPGSPAGAPPPVLLGEVLPVTSFGVHVMADSQRTVTAPVAGTAAGSDTRTLTQGVALRASRQSGPLLLSAQVSEDGQLADPRLQVTARASYDLGPTLAVGLAGYGVSRSGAARGFTLRDDVISGAEVRIGGIRAYRLPSLTFNLPLDSDVLISVNGQAGRAFRAQAGPLTLKNIPLGTPNGLVSLQVRDATGTHTLERRYVLTDVTVSARSFAALAHAGMQGGPVTADAPPTPLTFAANVSGAYGLSETWSLAGQAFFSPAVTRAQLAARYSDVTFGAGVNVDYDSVRSVPFAVTADAAYSDVNWRLAAAVRVPLPDPTLTQLSAQLSYHTGPTDLNVRVLTSPWNGSGEVGGSVSRRVNDTLNVAADLGYSVSQTQGAGWRAALRVDWTPTPDLTVLAAAEVVPTVQTSTTPASGPVTAPDPISAGPTTGTDTTTGVGVTAGLQVAYQLQPGRAVSAGVNSRGGRLVGSVRYSENREIAATVTADTDLNVGLDADAGISLVGGQVYLNRAEPGPGVLVHTGVPGLPLQIGATSVTTDARGDALVLLGEGTGTVTVSPDFDHIPLTVTVQEDRLDVPLAQRGVVVVDWTGNFAQNAWLHLLWPDGTPVRYGRVQLGSVPDRNFSTDDQGWALIPALKAETTVQITEDPASGTRRCQATAKPGIETLSCLLTTP